MKTMLGEFLSANVSTPFLLFMVRGMCSHTTRTDALMLISVNQDLGDLRMKPRSPSGLAF